MGEAVVKARGRPWLAMAVLAVLSLGVTVFLAQRALGDASDVVIRGEGDSLIAAVAVELTEDGAPPSAAKLERALSAHEQAGLRYLAIVDREGHAVAEAGTPEMRDVVPRPGQSRVVGKRARVAGPLVPPRRPHGAERPPERHIRDRARQSRHIGAKPRV